MQPNLIGEPIRLKRMIQTCRNAFKKVWPAACRPWVDPKDADEDVFAEEDVGPLVMPGSYRVALFSRVQAESESHESIPVEVAAQRRAARL